MTRKLDEQGKPIVVHMHKLETTTKLLLAAIALALAANAFGPFTRAREIQAQVGGVLGVITLQCKGTLPQHGKTMELECTGAQL